MAIFGRRKPPDPPEPRDETFEFFTVSEAARFRDLCRQGFAEAGLEVTAYADHLVDSSGRTFGLGNVAANCHHDERGERAWREVTARHAARTVRAMDAPSPFETMTPAQLFAATYLRLMPTADLAPFRVGYARPVVDGLSEVLNVDLPESVATYLDEHVERFGPLADLCRAGLANLRQVPVDAHEVLERDGGRVDVLLGDSMFLASTLLVLDHVLAREGVVVAPAGVLVAVPFRHQLDYHVIEDLGVVRSLSLLAGFARAGYDAAAGQLSPDVFWWRDGVLERLTVNTPEGIRVEAGPAFTEMLGSLA
jgi:hypothetical protein